MPNARIQKDETTQSRNLTILKCQVFLKIVFFYGQKGPLNPASEGSHYIYEIVDCFSNYISIVPFTKNNDHFAANSIIQHKNSEFGPPQCLITEGGSEKCNSEMANCCTALNFRHSPRTSHAPWTHGLVEVQNDFLEAM